MEVLGFVGNLSPTKKITVAELAEALAGVSGGGGLQTSVTELVAGLNALLLYLDIDPAVLVDDDGNPLIDENGNLIIG